MDLGVDSRWTQNIVGTVSLQEGHCGEIRHGRSRDLARPCDGLNGGERREVKGSPVCRP